MSAAALALGGGLALCAAAGAAVALVSLAARLGELRAEVHELRVELRERMPARLAPRSPGPMPRGEC
jgi:hypothetical protein